MPDMDEFFPREGGSQHPMLRLLLATKSRHPGSELRVQFHRARDGATLSAPCLYVSVITAQIVHDTREVMWDPNLNEALIDAGARAETLENESERFGYLMRELLQAAEVRFGDGYFNAVIVRLLRESALSRMVAVAEKLKGIRENRPSIDGRGYQDCRDAINAVVAYMGKLLVQPLHYPRPEAERVLASAVAYYLDERFHVTSRKLMGF